MSVVYVAGAMRSGTTIAGQIVASSDDALLIGEIKPALLDASRHQSCDCGRPREHCPFWSPVEGGASPAALEHSAGFAYSLVALPALLAALWLRRPVPERVRPVVEMLRRARTAAGGQVVVDTSKTPVGIVLWRLAGERVHVVDCVRDPREVAAVQATPSAATNDEAVSRLRSLATWVVYQALTLALRPAADSFSVVGYRRLRQRPREVARTVWRRAGLPPAPDTGAQFAFGQTHVLVGNPRRSQSGSVTISPLR